MAVEQRVFANFDIPDFRVGDTVRVTFRLTKEEIVTTGDQQKKEGRKEREPVTTFEGVVIRKRGEGTGATFHPPKTRPRSRNGTDLLLAFAPNIVKIEVLRGVESDEHAFTTCAVSRPRKQGLRKTGSEACNGQGSAQKSASTQ
jgi:ribosomal protein L19